MCMFANIKIIYQIAVTLSINKLISMLKYKRVKWRLNRNRSVAICFTIASSAMPNQCRKVIRVEDTKD